MPLSTAEACALSFLVGLAVGVLLMLAFDFLADRMAGSPRWRR